MSVQAITRVVKVGASGLSKLYAEYLEREPVSANRTTSTHTLPKHGALSYQSGQIYFSNMPLSEHLRRSIASDQLGQIASELEGFRITLKNEWDMRRRSWFAKNLSEIERALSLIDAFMQKVSSLTSARQQSLQSGVSLFFDEDGQLILNGVNVTAFVMQHKTTPSDKSRIYLKGLRDRLERGMQAQGLANVQARYGEPLRDMIREMDEILEECSEL